MVRLAGLLLFVLFLPGLAQAAESSLWELGLRGGTDASGSNENFTAGELYLLRFLPWQIALGEGTLLRTRFDMGAGYLEAVNDEGGWLAAGGDLVLSLFDEQLELEAGFRPTWLTDYRYGADDFGGDTQFSSHAGLACKIDHVTFNYRFQHISNAGIYDSNPGINLHLFAMGFRF